MKVYAGALTLMAAEGRLSVQVPHLNLRIVEGQVAIADLPTVEIPDEWIESLKGYGSGHRRCTGRELGFWHLSRAGYEANKEALRAALVGNARGTTWEQYEAAAEAHFADVEAGTARYQRALRVLRRA